MAERTTDKMADVPGRNADGLWCCVRENTTGTTVDHPAGGWFVILYNDESDHSATHCDSMGAVMDELYREGFSPVDVGWCVDNLPPWSEWTWKQLKNMVDTLTSH